MVGGVELIWPLSRRWLLVVVNSSFGIGNARAPGRQCLVFLSVFVASFQITVVTVIVGTHHAPRPRYPANCSATFHVDANP